MGLKTGLFWKFISIFFGDLKKVNTFAARLRKNGLFFEILREIKR